MDAVLRAAAVYALLLVVLRLAGRRPLGRLTLSDFVVLLVLGEAAQHALLGQDLSLARAVLVVAALGALQLALVLLRHRVPAFRGLADRVPIVVMADGRCLPERMRRAGVDERDLLEAARRSHGLAGLSEVAHAVVEADGTITVVPRPPTASPRRAA